MGPRPPRAPQAPARLEATSPTARGGRRGWPVSARLSPAVAQPRPSVSVCPSHRMVIRSGGHTALNRGGLGLKRRAADFNLGKMNALTGSAAPMPSSGLTGASGPRSCPHVPLGPRLTVPWGGLGGREGCRMKPRAALGTSVTGDRPAPLQVPRQDYRCWGAGEGPGAPAGPPPTSGSDGGLAALGAGVFAPGPGPHWSSGLQPPRPMAPPVPAWGPAHPGPSCCGSASWPHPGSLWGCSLVRGLLNPI